MSSMKFKPPPKRKKLDGPPSDRPIHDAQQTKRDAASTSIYQPTVFGAQASSVDIRIQQARNSAVAQAQQDGCTGNFRIFDSPFGNYLVPVIPTRADLGG